MVDVNVHPNKQEVTLEQSDDIRHVVTEMIEEIFMEQLRGKKFQTSELMKNEDFDFSERKERVEGAKIIRTDHREQTLDAFMQ